MLQIRHLVPLQARDVSRVPYGTVSLGVPLVMVCDQR
jgi:hypothetical protein